MIPIFLFSFPPQEMPADTAALRQKMASWLERRRVAVWENDVMMWTIFVPFHPSKQYTTIIDRQQPGVITVYCHLVDFSRSIRSEDRLVYERQDPRSA
jgi:hypothetical protein